MVPVPDVRPDSSRKAVRVSPKMLGLAAVADPVTRLTPLHYRDKIWYYYHKKSHYESKEKTTNHAHFSKLIIFSTRHGTICHHDPENNTD